MAPAPLRTALIAPLTEPHLGGVQTFLVDLAPISAWPAPRT